MITIQILKLTRTKELIFAVVFTGLAVLVPLFFHLIRASGAGQMFLPMNFIVLAGALIFGKAELSSGWRVGLVVGIFAPLISYSLTGMPAMAILPFIIIELSVAGFLAGWLVRKKVNIYICLVDAIVISKLLTGIAVFALPTNLLALKYVFGGLEAGWLGILAQIIFLPLLVKKLGHSKDERI